MVNGYNLNDISEKQIPLMRRTIGVVFQDFRLIEKKTVYELSLIHISWAMSSAI